MSISFLKSNLKRSPALNTLNAAIKSYLQEKQAKRSLDFYREAAKKRPYSLEKNNVVAALKKRFLAKGINPTRKRKGDLNIFLAFGLSNWERILPVALQPFGKVNIFEWRSMGFDDYSRDWLKCRDRMNVEMLKSFHKANLERPVDAVIGYLSGYNTDPKILSEIGKDGAVIFNFCWDDKLNFPGQRVKGRYTSPAAVASAVDLNLTNSPESIIKYVVHGGLAMFWPEAAHPDIHKPYDLSFQYNVSFVGGKYGWRPKFIEKLKRTGINVTCFGNSWENGPLSDEEMVKLYSRSRINLGFAGVGHSKKLMCLKGRDFEVPISGGLYLTQDNPELSLVYGTGKEIVTYRDEKDCGERIKWLLANPDEADKIRKAGRKRALKNHTWEKRFEDVFRLAGVME